MLRTMILTSITDFFKKKTNKMKREIGREKFATMKSNQSDITD